MTPERWERVKALFADASARAPQDRLAFVNSACEGDDDELREEVLSLLRSAEGTDSLPAARGAIAAVLAADPRLGGVHGISAAAETELRAALQTALGQQYEIVRLLGHGAMGTVYLARERALERFVAIKALRPELALSHDGRERFRREARVAAQLSHPGIVPLHTFGELGGVWYFVMGYVGGVTLAERLRVEGRLPSAEVRRILAELADALDSAHGAGVIHRDIKPANILIDSASGRAVLADFGIAKIHDGGDGLTEPGMVVGTPSYMSPEQARGESVVDARSDLYSLGAVGYTMLSGGPLAPGAARSPRDVATDVPDVSRTLVAVVMRCLANEPSERWPSARALGDALALADEEASSGLPAIAHELPAFGPYALLWATLWLTLAASPFRSLGDRALLSLIALIVPAGLILHAWNVARGGLPAWEIARVAFWPPEWWGMWWPRALRRPSDLWKRLPWRARLVRSALSLFIVTLPALILTRQWVEAVTGAGVGWFGAAETALVLSVVVVIVSVAPWAYQRGLTTSEVVRLLFGATTMSAGWTSPALRRLLAPERGVVRPPEPREPADYPRAIDEVVDRLDVSLRESAIGAADAAHRLMEALDRCDTELRAVSMAGGLGQSDRIAAQIAAIESTKPEGDEMRGLVELLRAQLELVRRMQVRCEMLSSRRAHLLHLLHGTWTHLAALQDAAPDARAETVSRLDTVRRGIEMELAALKTADPQ